MAVAIGRLNIFGPWKHDGEHSWCRPEPRRDEDSRMRIWYAPPAPGYRWRIGFGVCGIPGITRHEPLATLEEAMADIDRDVRTNQRNVLVDPRPGIAIENERTPARRAAELEKTMQCNCDLDNWQPEKSTGHSWVCRIHKEACRRTRLEEPG